MKKEPTPATTVFLSNWKTSIPYVICGIIVGVLFQWALDPLVTTHVSESTVGIVAAAISASAIYSIVDVVYCLVIYRSLFTDKPKVKSNNVVAFLNGLFGSIIWGSLFSHNLTRGKRGVSYIVLAVIEIIGAILFIGCLCILWGVAS